VGKLIQVRLRVERNAVRLAAALGELLAPRGVMPVIKRSLVVLDDSGSELRLTLHEALPIVRTSLQRAGIPYKLITVKDGEIEVIDEESGEGGEAEKAPKLYVCPHCGFTTPYEEEYWVHLKIHYLGF